MRSDADIPDEHADAWQKGIPYDTRQGAIKELLTAYDSAFALKRNGHVQSFMVHYKKKAPNQVFHCRANAFSAANQTIFNTRLKGSKSKLRTRKRDLTKLIGEEGATHSDFVVQKMRPGAWYLCAAGGTGVRERRLPVSVLGPGCEFHAFYSPTGCAARSGTSSASASLTLWPNGSMHSMRSQPGASHLAAWNSSTRRDGA
jgi:hypothetical protein